MICEGELYTLLSDGSGLNQLIPAYTPAVFQWENDLDGSSQIWAKTIPFDLFRCHVGRINLILP